MARPTQVPALTGGKLDLSAPVKPHPLAPKEQQPAITGRGGSPGNTRGEATAMLAGRIPVSLRNKFKAKAAGNGLTVAEVLEQIVKEYVEK